MAFSTEPVGNVREARFFQSEGAEQNGFVPRSGFVPFHLAHAKSTVAIRFREVAGRHSGSLALIGTDGARCTYEELWRRSIEIAASLAAQLEHTTTKSLPSATPPPVALLIPFSLPAIEAIFGVLLAGRAYFPIDPAWPDAQIARLLAVANPAMILTNAASRERFRDLLTDYEDRLINIAKLDTTEYREGPPLAASTHDIAVLFATSGSTGEPKLVALSHRAILFDVGRQTNDLCLGPDDRFDLLFSLAFSASLAPLFGALLNGAELHLIDLNRDLARLADTLEERRISISTMSVSTLRSLFLRPRRRYRDPALRLVSVGGEALLVGDVVAFHELFAPPTVLQNAMASTEARTYAQYFVPRLGPTRSPVSIGWPAAGKEVVLLDESGAPVTRGAAGEIAVRSRYLADGYYNDPQGTGAKFQTQPNGTVLYRTGDLGRFQSDGSLIFLGRTDSQVKIRGYRVELEAVSQAINLHPAVRASVAVAREDSIGNIRLVAYIVARQGDSVAEEALRAFLREHLPTYAVPAAFIFLADLPLNANGKVDLRGLPAYPGPNIGGRGPSKATTIEILHDIWTEVLQRPQCSPEDSFFDAGGDSLSGVHVLVAIRESLGCDLPSDSLQRFPRLKDLAAYVDHACAEGIHPGSLIILQGGGSGPPVFFVPGIGGSVTGYAHIASEIAPRHRSYEFRAPLGLTTNSAVSVESIARESVTAISRVVPTGPVVLVGYSFGGTVAFEIARQLRKSGAYEPLPIVIDMPLTNAPGVRHPPFWRQALDVARNIPAWLANEAANYQPRKLLVRGQGHLARFGRSLRGRPVAHEFDSRVYFGTASLPAAYRDFLTVRYRALLTYKPGPYEGKVILLRAKVPTLFRSRDARMGWEAVAAGGVEVHHIPGGHDDCVSAAHCAELGRLLMRCVEKNQL